MTAVSALVGGEGVEPSVQIIAALAAYPPVVGLRLAPGQTNLTLQ